MDGNGHTGAALTRSPLLTGAATLVKADHVITNETFVKMRRLMAFARQEGMVAMYFCPLCQEPIKLTHDATIVDATGQSASDAPVRLDCACTTWRVR